ncbi:MAG: M20/M25/M40 family metallo-hydrolase [Candidatus Cloacimonadaceae bacterium]
MQDEIISYFLKLVKIDSESGDERQMIDTLKEDLLALGALVEEDNTMAETKSNAGNLYAYIAGEIDKDPILLCAHVDTVVPGKGVKPRIVGDIIESDGTTVLGGDDKSGVAEIMIALKRIKEKGIPHAPIEVLFTVSEEIDLLGAKHFDKSRLKSRFGFAFDSHRVEDIVVGAPSQNSFDVVFKGIDAHAGVEPEKGLSAIRLAAEAIAAMPLGRIDYETTCSVGIIKGGEATNIVPNKVIIRGEARSHNTEKLARICAEIESTIQQAIQPYAEKGGKAEITFVREYQAFRIPESSEMVQLAKTALQKLNVNPSFKIGGGGSDANIFNAAGFPMILIGTGMDKVHTVHESIEIAQLKLGTNFIEKLIMEYSEA